MQHLQKNINITNLSNFKTKAFAKYFYEIKCEDSVKKLKEIVEFASSPLTPLLQGEGDSKTTTLAILFVWAWTNMLFAFEKFEGIVIKNSLQGWNYNKKTKVLETFSNELISDIAESLEKDYGQNLWHRFIWLPWSIWWAVFWNAGCFWLETENNLVEVTAYNLKTWQIEVLWKKDCDFSYRNSIFKKTEDYFIIKAKFDLSKKIEKYHSDVDNIYFREHKQPKWNTCWSFFKNPKINRDEFFDKFPNLCEDCVKNISAWFLIEKSWLKGFQLKTAYFSDLHSNFLMSKDNWNHKDLLDLIKLAQKKVKEKFWIEIEPEVRIVTSS